MPTPAAAPAKPAPELSALPLYTADFPRIGQHWPAQGGHFAGIVAGENGAPDYLLIVGPEAPEELKWQQAIDWAAQLAIDGHIDFTLPNRRDQAVAYGNCKSLFQNGWYWSGEQSAGDAGYAWCQTFDYGYQDIYRKLSSLRARAVRRLAIQ